MREYLITADSGDGDTIRTYIEARHMADAFSIFVLENTAALDRFEKGRGGVTVTIFTLGDKHARNQDTGTDVIIAGSGTIGD